MFVGFIAVVVILLVIVGLMSSGATNGSGGVDQTKATKALSEVSALAQSTGFYKTTTAGSDYLGLTGVQQLIDAGIVATGDTVAATATMTGATLAEKVVKSKAVPGVYYKINVNATKLSTFDVTVVPDTTLISATSGMAAALEKAITKVQDTAAVAGETGFLVNVVANDGASTITY